MFQKKRKERKKQSFTYFKGETFTVNRLVSGASRVSTGNGNRATEPVVLFFCRHSMIPDFSIMVWLFRSAGCNTFAVNDDVLADGS